MLENIMVMPEHLQIVLILTVASVLAAIFGYLSTRLHLSPILGYLLAGYLIGPYSPGLVVNLKLSEQLAEIGVILMLFWVGLHIKWRELLHVKNIAIIGALGQTFFSTLLGALIIHSLGWSLESAIVIGISIGIASTVVLVRVLTENGLHNTKAGHICLSWLICEDFIAVFALLMLPALSQIITGEYLVWKELLFSILGVLAKFTLWALVLFTLGLRLVSYILNKILKIHIHELFTLTTLALTFVIAVGFSSLTGISIALGAFIAGMVISQTGRINQVSDNLRPLKDAFVVFFFLSIGMLFNPTAIIDNFLIFIIVLAIIIFAKPLAAWIIIRLMKYSKEISITVALALAQIGEFSFILAEEANRLKILPDQGYDIIIACAFVSLALNPLLFKGLKYYSAKAYD